MALVMNFVEPYLLAMRDKAPKLLKELQKHGRLDQHLAQKDEEAYALLREVLRGNENPTLAEKRHAEEIVFATLIEFPDEYLKNPKEKLNPPDDLVGLPYRGEGRKPGEYAGLMADLFQQQDEGPKVPNQSQGNEEDDSANHRPVGTGIEKAIWRFARERFERLTQDIAAELQEHSASGVYGDVEDENGHPLETLWDEFRYEVQFGPHDDVIDFAWGGTLHPFYKAKILMISDPERRLLFLETNEGMSFDLGSDELPPVLDDDVFIEELDSVLRGLAGRSGEREEEPEEDNPEQLE